MHWWNFLQLEALHSVWTFQGVRAHISPPSPDQKGPVPVQRREWGREGRGDSRLLACVVFPLRDLYTDAVGINFWWTIGTASSPLALLSHPLSSDSLSLTCFTHVCKLASLYAALLYFRVSVSHPGTSVSLSKSLKGVEGFGTNFFFFSLPSSPLEIVF